MFFAEEGVSVRGEFNHGSSFIILLLTSEAGHTSERIVQENELSNEFKRTARQLFAFINH